jgi:anti-sigma factor RsiW
MKPCDDHKETLWLDVYGELLAKDRPAWERHMAGCEGCRQERERLLRLLGRLKEAMPAPTLSSQESSALTDAIQRDLRKEREKIWWGKRPFSLPNRLIPALAAACLVVVAIGWFTLRGLKTPSSIEVASELKTEEQVIAKDLEIIKNLELLEEMDVIQQLVRVVGNGTPYDKAPENGKI